MKKLILFTAGLLACGMLRAAEPLECIQPGTELTYGIYKASGKLMGYQVIRVVSCEQMDGYRLLTQTVSGYDLTMRPVKHPETKEVLPPDTTRLRLTDNELITLYPVMLGLGEKPVYENEELIAQLPVGASIRGEQSENIEFVLPFDATPEKTYEPFNLWFEMFEFESGNVMLRQEFTITPSIGGNEKITVPAGEFDCLKVIYTINVRASQMGQSMNDKEELVEWRAPGIGTVKSGPADRKGRMKDGYMELLSIKTAEAPQAAQ